MLVDAVFVSRPLLWVPVWGFALLGSQRVLGSSAHPLLSFGDGWILVLTLLFSCAVGCVYVLNQIADVEVDRANAGFALLAHGRISGLLAWAAAAALGLAALIVPLVLHRPTLAALSLCAILIGVAYSFAPLRLSGRPAADFAANAVGYGCVAFGAGWHLAGGAWGVSFLASAAPYVLLMAAGSISSTIPDIDGDRTLGKRTTAVALGPLGAHVVATVLLACAGVAAVVVSDRVAAVCAAGCVPLYIVHLFARRAATAEAAYKVGGALCMLVVAAYWPFFALLSAAVYGGTVVYFRLRFGIRYPSLLPATHVN
jgi:4-hydroxybenzoate polyprenyltransferase